MNNEWKDGMPPIGADCEYSFNMFDDESMTIPATFIGMDGRAAVIKVYNPERKYTSTTINCLRPIKSQADKLRDEQIMDLDAALRKTQKLSGEYLYNQGCRMTRELTDEAATKILHRNISNTASLMREVAEYVRGELEL